MWCVKEMTSPAENQCINADRPNGASLAWPTSGRALTTKSSGRLNLNVLDGGKASWPPVIQIVWDGEGGAKTDRAIAAQQKWSPCELDYLISVTWFIPRDAAAKRRPEFQLSADQRTAATDTENISGSSASSLCHSCNNLVQLSKVCATQNFT